LTPDNSQPPATKYRCWRLIVELDASSFPGHENFFDRANFVFKRGFPLTAGTPQPSADYAKRASSRYVKGDLDGALADYERAILLNPNLAELYVKRGDVRRAKGDLQGAISDYDHAATSIHSPSKTIEPPQKRTPIVALYAPMILT